MIKIQSTSSLADLTETHPFLLPVLFRIGIPVVKEGLSISDSAKKWGLNDDFLLYLLAVCLDEDTLPIQSITTYSLLKLIDLCQSYYKNALCRMGDLVAQLNQLIQQHQTSFTWIAQTDLELRLNAYYRELSKKATLMETIIIPHVQLVYELYYSPAFTALHPDLLDYSIEFFGSVQDVIRPLYQQWVHLFDPLMETAKLSCTDVVLIQGLSEVHASWLLQEKLEQQLLKPLVLQMEETIFATLHKEKKSFYRNNSVSFIASDLPPSVLTSREKEVLTLIAMGYMNKEIADQLAIALTTVITHRKRVIEKLGIRTISGLTVYAYTHGYINNVILINED
jgi:DNA-binding CsgD family transcriptional regulator